MCNIALTWKDIARAGLIGVAVFVLNEFVFPNRQVSEILNILILLVFILCQARPIWTSVKFLLFVSLALNVRPRELHLIPIADRGSFEYFSPNIFGYFGVSLTTIMIAMIGVRVVFELMRRRKAQFDPIVASIISVILLGYFGSLFSVIEDGKLFVGAAITDIKYPTFILVGCYTAYLSPELSVRRFFRFIVHLGLVLAFVTISNLLFDVYSSSFKLAYNPSVFLSIIALSIMIIYGSHHNVAFILGIMLIGLSSFPFTRGEQLVFFVAVLVMMVSQMRDRFLVGLGRVAAIAASIVVVLIIFMYVSPETILYVERKFALFATMGSILDCQVGGTRQFS